MRARTTRTRCAVAALAAGAAACASAGNGRPAIAGGAPIEDARVAAEHKQDLVRLERLFVGESAGYEDVRAALVRRTPGLAPWIAKAMTGHAVRAYERLLLGGRALEIPARVEECRTPEMKLLFRARAELVSLGDPGRAAIVAYLVRNTRGPLRELGGRLLSAHPQRALVRALRGELDRGTPASRREALRLLAGCGNGPDVIALLGEKTRSKDWQMRGTAVRALGVAWRGSPEAEPARLLEIARDDDDGWVRSQALLALGELGDTRQVRPLVDALEASLVSGRGREAEAAARSLGMLTGQSLGTSVVRWRAWLGGSKERRWPEPRERGG